MQRAVVAARRTRRGARGTSACIERSVSFDRMTLRSARALGEKWDPLFFERDPRFWPIANVARAFRDRPDWPAPEELAHPDVRFVTTFKHKRTRTKTLDPDNMYDARILRGEVPTRPRCWHDFLNALVWMTFPKSKRALHERQAACVRAWIPSGATTLPNARTREHDALALVDEGGVIVIGDVVMAFGHALYEGLVFGTPAMIARALHFDGDAKDADALLAARLREPLVPEDLPRFTFR